MSQLGVGVMLRLLTDRGPTFEAIQRSLGKKIRKLGLEGDDSLLIEFEDDTALNLEDMGQSCCEHRYMTCDDDLAPFVGAEFRGASVKDGPDQDAGYDTCHDVQFLVVETSAGSFTVATHNEHNGYYGGFSIEASIRSAT